MLGRAENIPLPQSLEYVLTNCGANILDIDDSEKIADGLFCIKLALKKRINHLKIVINGILTCDEQNTVRRQKSFIVNKLLEDECTNYINTDIHYLRSNRDWIRENGHLDKFNLNLFYLIYLFYILFYKDNLHLVEKEYLKLALSIKRKINLIQDNFTATNNIEKKN